MAEYVCLNPLHRVFNRVDTNRSGDISAHELGIALKNGKMPASRAAWTTRPNNHDSEFIVWNNRASQIFRPEVFAIDVLDLTYDAECLLTHSGSFNSFPIVLYFSRSIAISLNLGWY